MTTTNAPVVEIERHDDATYVHIDGEFAGSVVPRWAPGDRGAVVSGWFVRDERAGVNHGARTWRRNAEASLAHRLGISIPLR